MRFQLLSALLYLFLCLAGEAKANGLENFIELCMDRFPAVTKTQQIKSLRHCVNLYSTHLYPKGTAFPDTEAAVQSILDYAVGKTDEPPPMECYYRSRMLSELLAKAGFETKTITLARNADNFPGHVLLLVKNPDTNIWEIHDPSYDVDFGASAIPDLLSINIDAYAPCNFEGRCGWDLSAREGLNLMENKSYWYAAFVTGDKLYISRNRMDEKIPRPVNGKSLTLCEAFPNWCEKIEYVD